MEGVTYNVSESSGQLELLLQSFQNALDNFSSSPLDNTTGDIPSMVCQILYLPSVSEYHQGLDRTGLSFVITVSLVAVFIVLGLFLDTLKHVITSTPAHLQTNTITLIAIYPIVAVVTFCSIVVPRAQFVMETVVHETFMVCLYHMFCLTISSCGGERGFLDQVKPTVLDPRVGPCCCYPCCIWLPTTPPNKGKLRFLRLLVLQATVIQGFIYMIFLVLWSESQELFYAVYNYAIVAVVISVLSGIWGLVMTLQMTFGQDHLKHLLLKEKYIVFQLVLVLSKLQLVVAKLVAANTSIFPCSETISPTLFTNLIYYMAVIWEMVLLSFLARNFYKRPMTPKKGANLAANLPEQITNIQDKIPPSEIINNNNSTIVVRF